MERKTQMIFAYATQLRLSSFKDQLDEVIKQADQRKSSYSDFALSMLQLEVNYRKRRDLEKRIKTAWLPMKHDLDAYDHSASNGLSKTQLNQLRECQWLEQNYNLIIMGPSGVGKTLLASGLCNDALKLGYKAYFRTMEQIIEMIKLKDITRSAASEYKRLLKADLVVIDDIMMFALDKTEAVGLFNFVNHLHEKASFIITTNKSPNEWVKLLDDEVIATALLDRLLFHGEVLSLKGKSYRLEHRKTIFTNQN